MQQLRYLRLNDWLLEHSLLAWRITVAYTLLVLVFREKRIATASEQHHSNKEWDDCLDCHIGRSRYQATVRWCFELLAP